MGKVYAIGRVCLHNTLHSSTAKAPFKVIYGKVILPPIFRTKDEIFVADEYVRDMDTAFAQVKAAIERSNEHHKEAANKHK